MLGAAHLIAMLIFKARYIITVTIFCAGWLGWGVLSEVSFEHWLNVTVTFLLLWSMHMAVLLHLLNSVSLAMIRLLLTSADGTMPREAFLAHFSDDNTLAFRIQLLTGAGLIEKMPDGMVQITPRGKFFGSLFGFFQRIFRITYTG